jgi:hypothetical protein
VRRGAGVTVRAPGGANPDAETDAGRGPAVQGPPSRASILRGEYGRYRANNDLLYYHLDVKADPDKQLISGKNTIRFRMLQDDTRIQIDLYANLAVDRILLGTAPLKYERELNAVFIDFPETLKKGREYADRFLLLRNAHAHGPVRRVHVPERRGLGPRVDLHRMRGRRLQSLVAQQGSVARRSRKHGHQHHGAEPARGGVKRAVRQEDRPRRRVHAVGLGRALSDQLVRRLVNATDYVHFDDTLGDVTLDFYATPENFDKAKAQFAQAKPMIEAYKKFFGEYPFAKDGYKLIEVPYTGMEHQSAVTYGNGYRNGYGGRDWTGVGISPKFDFIIIHESAATSGSETPCRQPTCPTCGFRRAGARTSRACTWNSCSARPTA